MSRVRIHRRRSAELVDRRLWAYKIAGQVAAAYTEEYRHPRLPNFSALADDVADSILDELEGRLLAELERRRGSS